MAGTNRSRALSRLHIAITAGATAIAIAICVAVFAPTRADAFMSPNVVLSSHKGWVYVGHKDANGVFQPGTYTAWAWTYSGWQRRSLGSGTRVYSWPYAEPWMWAWTSQTGWLAIKRADLDTGYYCDSRLTATTCPVF